MPKGLFSKIKGTICNFPFEADHICNILPRDSKKYNNVIININNIQIDLLSLNGIPILREEEVYNLRNKADILEEVENPLDQYRIGVNESALISTVSCEINEENITVAADEGLKPI